MKPSRRTPRVKVAKFQGVYYREFPEKRHDGKADKVFDVNYKDRHGKLKWEKIGWMSEGYTAALASQVRAERIRSIRHGLELPQDKEEPPTLAELWKKYLEWAKSNKRSWQTDEFRYEKHLKKRLGNKRLDEITPFLIEKTKSRLLNSGASPQSTKHVLALIRQMLNKGKVWGLYAGENPVQKVKLPSTANANRLRFLSAEEVGFLLDAVQKTSQQFYEICLISLHTGMRANEVFSLTWGAIDLENGIINIPDSKILAGRAAYITTQLKDFFKKKTPGEPRDLVFLSQRGEKIKSVSGTFDNIATELGFNKAVTDRRWKVVFHTLRHTFASWLALDGRPLQEIKVLMGHRSIRTTERYAHLIPDEKRTAIKGFEATFENGLKAVVEKKRKEKEEQGK